jgi:hypothetical protein
MAVPYTFGTATASIPLSQLDSNFATVITLGNTAIQLGNTVTTLNNMTLANVTISSGNITLTNVSATTANVTTANVVTMIVTGNETVLGNTTVTGTATAAKLIPTGSSVTGNGMYLPATNSVGISTAGTNAVYIDASQNVLLGTTSAGSYGQKQVISGGFGLTIAATFALTNSVQKISAGVGLLCYIRDTTNGHTALVIYENSQTPIIVLQTSASKFITTGTPIGTQILLGNANQSPLNTAGIQASTASGAGITVSVATVSCQNS